jgi:hypothetical protein
LLGIGSVDTFLWQRIHSTIDQLFEASFSIRSLSYKRSLWVSLRIPLLLLGHGSAKTFPRQCRIIGGVVFYAVRVVAKERKRLVLTRTSCLFFRKYIRLAGARVRVRHFPARLPLFYPFSTSVAFSVSKVAPKEFNSITSATPANSYPSKCSTPLFITSFLL